MDSLRDLLKTKRRLVFLIIGLAVFVLIYLYPTPSGLTEAGKKSLAIFSLCAIYWVFDVLPLMITGLLAILLFPLMGILEAGETFALFGNQAVFFILGAFILSSGLLRSGLSQRIALLFLRRFGKTPRRLVLATLLFPALSSLFITEHAVAAMFFPIVVEISGALRLEPGQSRMGKALFLSMAWGCVLGGIGTYLGGARAPLALAILSETTGEKISFLTYSLCALPTVIFGLFFAGVAIMLFFPPEIDSVLPAKELLEEKIKKQGRISRRELAMGILMVLVIFAWVAFGHKLGLAIIALAGVVMGFVFKLLVWKEVEEDVNWGVFLLYGGAISLGLAMSKTQALEWLAGRSLSILASHPIILVIFLPTLAIFLTELVSNSAVVALLVPVGIGIGAKIGFDPKVIMLLITIPSGLAFMLPVGTPANAIAFSSGYYRIRDSVRAGLLVNIPTLIFFLLSAWIYWRWLGLGF